MSKHRTKSSPREAVFASGRRRFDRSRRVLAHASRPFDPRVSVGVRRTSFSYVSPTHRLGASDDGLYLP